MRWFPIQVCHEESLEELWFWHLAKATGARACALAGVFGLKERDPFHHRSTLRSNCVVSLKQVLVSNLHQGAIEQPACRINSHSWGRSRALRLPDRMTDVGLGRNGTGANYKAAEATLASEEGI